MGFLRRVKKEEALDAGFGEPIFDEVPTFFPNEPFDGEAARGEIFLELEHDTFNLAVIMRNADGYTTATHSLGQAYPDQPIDSAQDLVARAGWRLTGEWTKGEKSSWVPIRAAMFSVKFVGTELPDEQVLSLARQAGFTVGSVLHQHEDFENGTTVVDFVVDEPHGWTWEFADWFQ